MTERSGARRLRATLPQVAPTDSARRTYRAMITDQVTPVLEEWGFTAADDCFRFPSTVWHLGVSFTPFAWSTVTTFRFDVRVFAAPRESWRQWRALEPALPAEPDPAVYYAHDVARAGGIKASLGELSGGGADARWAVHAGEDPSAVAAHVLTALQRFVVPAFVGRSEISREAS
jgi:hypothetical protein